MPWQPTTIRRRPAGHDRWPVQPGRAFFCVPLLLSLAVVRPGFSQSSGNVRIYNAEDGLRDAACTAIAVSPRGNVWLKHGELDEISWLDGYSVNKLPSPGGANYRIQEIRSAKLAVTWSVSCGSRTPVCSITGSLSASGGRPSAASARRAARDAATDR